MKPTVTTTNGKMTETEFVNSIEKVFLSSPCADDAVLHEGVKRIARETFAEMLKKQSAPKAAKKAKGPGRELLKKVYFFVYDEFSAYTKDVVDDLKLTRPAALAALNALEKAGLICGDFTDGQGTFGNVEYHGKENLRKRWPGKNKIWQCWKTYDSIDADEAEKLFNEKMGV
jgi:hypothetical protein